MQKLELTEQEVLEGLVLANQEILSLQENMIINKSLGEAKRVAIVAMCASGNEPSLAGFVGQGLLDIVVVGQLEAAPGPAKVLEAVKLADRGQGVILLVLNNSGDILTSNIVMKQAFKEGLQLARVIVQDETAKIVTTQQEDGQILQDKCGCQGLLGALAVAKVAGAAAAAGKSLEEVTALAQKVADQAATVALGQEELPEARTAEEVAANLVPQALQVLAPAEGEQVLLLVNGNGVASLREQLAVARHCYVTLAEAGLQATIGGVDNYFTGQPEVYVQLCLIKASDEILTLWQASCRSTYYNK